MQLVGMILVSALMVPPGQPVVNHNQPGHSGELVIRRFERREEDDARHRAWNAYVRELDDLWAEYRDAGSTPRAWQQYIDALSVAKRDYVYRDRYLAPVTDNGNSSR
jgi:hypothetical protein